MMQADFDECLRILRNKPLFLFRKEDVEQKLKCFEKFKDNGNPQIIWVLTEFLTDENPVLRDAAARAVVALFEKIKSLTAFYVNLKYIDFEPQHFELFRKNFALEIYITLLQVASFNKSGYVREKAVKELAATQNPKAIRFIIFRLGDWVANVRENAETALRSFFQPRFIEDFLNLLPFTEWLLNVGRADLAGFYAEIYWFIFGFDLTRDFYEKIRRFGDKTKFIYVRNYLKANLPTREVFELLAEDEYFLVKVELLKHLEKLDEATQKRIIARFLDDRSPKVRIYALYATKPFRAEFHDRILNAVFDASASVRELARFILRDSGVDFAELYRRRLKENENSLGAILGLTEIGTQADLTVFEAYVQKTSVRIKLACLTALKRLNKEIAGRWAIEFLFHPSAKVRNKSVEISSTTRPDEILTIARELYPQGTVEQKKSILKLFERIGGWRVVGDFIIALSDPNEDVRNLGWRNLEKWRSRQLFTRPSAEDHARTKRLYEEFDKIKPELDSSREIFWSQLPFYLK